MCKMVKFFEWFKFNEMWVNAQDINAEAWDPLCTTSLIKMSLIVMVGSTSIREVVYKVLICVLHSYRSLDNDILSGIYSVVYKI